MAGRRVVCDVAGVCDGRTARGVAGVALVAVRTVFSVRHLRVGASFLGVFPNFYGRYQKNDCKQGQQDAGWNDAKESAADK